MNYFRIREFNEDEDYKQPANECCIYKSQTKVKKGDVVVIENCYGNFPITAEVVVAQVNELQALTVRYDIQEVIAVIDMSEYNIRVQRRKQKAILADKMKSKMDEVKLVENFKKFAEKDDEMRELFRQFQQMGVSIPTENDEVEQDS